jgi:hypothetical protein
MSKATSITVRVPLAIRRRPGRKTLVTSLSDHGGPPASTGRADPALVKALARAHRWQRLLEEGRYASLGEMAAGERIDRGYLGRVLRLTLFAPPIIEAVLDGHAPHGVGLAQLVQPLPACWGAQQAELLNAPSPP